MTFLFSHPRVLHARLHARPGKNTELKRCPFCQVSSEFKLNEGMTLSKSARFYFEQIIDFS